MALKVYGNVLTQDNYPEIMRCLDSIAGVCDEIIVVDGFSTDGTWEWLNDMKDIYHLRLYQRKFDDHQHQRNFCLSATPEGWVVTLDSDETLDGRHLRIILQEVGETLGEEIPTIPTPSFTLINDTKHYAKDMLYSRSGYIFYNDGNLTWGVHPVHSQITRPLVERPTYLQFTPDDPIIVKHWAYLLPKRWDRRVKRMTTGKGKDHTTATVGDGDFTSWVKNKDKHDVQPLPMEFQ